MKAINMYFLLWIELCPPPQTSYVEALTLVPHNVTIVEDRAFKGD